MLSSSAIRSLPDDAFGDPFDLANLPLPRLGKGYAIQQLDTDRVLDRESDEFLSVRTVTLRALYPDFESAHTAASNWVTRHLPPTAEHSLAIVPASYDPVRHRHILIYGVLCGRP